MADFVKTRMTAKEYASMPESNQPMELIYGDLITLPTPKAVHQDISNLLAFKITGHVLGNGLGKVLTAPMDIYFDDEADVILQPDILFIAKDSPQCKIQEDRYWHGVPDLCVEIISKGSGKHDRVTKFDLYEKYGVREYWIVEPEERYLEVFVLDGKTYRKQGGYDETQSFSSNVLPGLTINLVEIFPAKEA